MQELTVDSGWLIHVAALLQVLGLLLRRQLLLRLFLLAGSLAYVAYFYAHAVEPMWAPVFWSAVLGTANAIGIARLVLERLHFRQSEEERRFLETLRVLSPGELRRLMRLAQWREAGATTTLTREGRPVRELYYVLDGGIVIDKAGKSFPVRPGVFIGEVAFLLDTPASATVTLAPGARYIAWPAGPLRRLIGRTPSLGLTMERLFNQELARKVARSWGA
ncbi:MAG: cyclic nucleotide-binding domain-containing protein [Kiloniellales bacterium]|nr:cyclic nucleotide-binding domain-containing protein [Kiloniellales bacterium]